MNARYIYLLLLGLDAFILFFQSSELSISYYEAKLLEEISFLELLVSFSFALFGQNDFALRLPMIFLHILSAMLLYEISKGYFQNAKERLWVMGIFMFLPGVVSSSLIVNDAGVLIFGLLLFVYLYKRISKPLLFTVLFSYLFVSHGFIYLYFSLIFFALYTKEKSLLIWSSLLFCFSLALYGFDTHGSPKGHFLDSLALFAVIVTPILFVYIVYTLYRRYLTQERDLLWHIASIPLVLSFILSFRQKIEVEILAPYLIVALPLAAATFYNSYRVRLREFRRKYKTIFIIAIVFLVMHSSLVLFNKCLYLVMQTPQKHFAYKMHVAKELAQILKEKGISCIEADERMGLRLNFYGISNCNEYKLVELNANEVDEKSVTISYNNRTVYMASVTKVHKKEKVLPSSH